MQLRAAFAALPLVLAAPLAHADNSIAAGGGAQAVTARIDAATMKLRYGKCATAPCPLTDEDAIKTSIPLDTKNARFSTVQMAGGKRALWVHIPSTGTISWDAILTGGATTLAFADETGFVRGQPGSMSGTLVRVVPDGHGAQMIARGSGSEDFSICSREAILRPEVLDPQTLEWHSDGFQQLAPADIASATRITATARQAPADKPLAPLLSVSAANTGMRPAALVDLDPATVWTETAAGIGRGEFVALNAPSEVPISKLSITMAAASVPKTFFLATADHVYAITMPEDASLHAGRAYDITLPQPLKTSCVALVLDDAFVHGTHVAVAELTAYSELDVPGATLASVAANLGAGGRTATVASAILKRAGDAALAPVGAVWDKLDVYGRELGLDVAQAAPASCGNDATGIYLRGLCDSDAHVSHKAESSLQQCGKRAAIVSAVQNAPAAMCAKMPQYLAMLGKQSALGQLAAMLKNPAMRIEARHAFANASANAPAQMLATMIADPQYTAQARLDMLRATATRLHELHSEATQALDALLVNAPMETRYLALEPLAELAKSNDRPAATHVAAMLAHDPDWQVRARAAELARDLPAVQSELVSAIDDAQPRVRQAALDTIASLKVSPAAVLVEKHLESDPWTFVRVASAHALGAMPAARDLDKALADVLGTDTSPQVRGAILDALAAHQARSYAAAVRARLDDVQELGIVRTAAARALGAMCDPSQLERLTDLARAAADPMAGGEDLALGLAAVSALGDIHPADLANRLAKLRDKSVRDAIRAAAEHAVASPGKCH